jgi:hypothetical protein
MREKREKHLNPYDRVPHVRLIFNIQKQIICSPQAHPKFLLLSRSKVTKG